jgi:hypothetical protein
MIPELVGEGRGGEKVEEEGEGERGREGGREEGRKAGREEGRKGGKSMLTFLRAAGITRSHKLCFDLTVGIPFILRG